MRAHRRSGPLQHVLIAGDVGELAAIDTVLALLPGNAYGQVYLEGDPGADLSVAAGPARVQVTPVVRGPHDAPGHRLSAAVAAWAAEWLTEEPDERRELTMWVGGSVRLTAAELRGTLARL